MLFGHVLPYVPNALLSTVRAWTVTRWNPGATESLPGVPRSHAGERLREHAERGPVDQVGRPDLPVGDDLHPGALGVAGHAVRPVSRRPQAAQLVVGDLGGEQVGVVRGHRRRDLAAAVGAEP